MYQPFKRFSNYPLQMTMSQKFFHTSFFIQKKDGSFEVLLGITLSELLLTFLSLLTLFL